MNSKEFLAISKAAFRKWQVRNATLRAAALAFFTVLPLPSSLIILLAIFRQVYGQNQAPQMLIGQISRVAGPSVAGMITSLLNTAADPFASIPASIINLVFALAGVIGAFAVLQDTLNIVWAVPRFKNRTLKAKIRGRAIPFLFVSFATVVVMVWIGSTTVMFESLRSSFTGPLVGAEPFFTRAVQIGLSAGLLTLLFAVLYKLIPEATIEWADVGLAALLTGVVSTVVNYVFGDYVQSFSFNSAVGVAGSLLFLLLWIFLSFEVMLYGAHFSKVYAETLGSRSKKTLPSHFGPEDKEG